MKKHPLFRQAVIISIVALSIFSIALLYVSDQSTNEKFAALVKFLAGIATPFFLVIMYIRYKEQRSN
ncbi:MULTISPECIES: hypothetical protein [Sphingobacterium]|uniref:Uncharacterized protein n=1 Tax=Sphingobacterium populi TaxID=1812824 RepID=A0ABW5UFM4_9SPHI|nr:hypothetical protein [Sphingobacterium sp. CFCC 11742]